MLDALALNSYKKHEDRGRFHPECVKQLVAQADPEAGAPRCPLCRQPYRLQVHKKFTFAKLFSFSALSQFSELVRPTNEPF